VYLLLQYPINLQYDIYSHKKYNWYSHFKNSKSLIIMDEHVTHRHFPKQAVLTFLVHY